MDLNYKGNPFIGNAGAEAPNAIRRATSLVLNTPTNVLTSLGDAKASYTALKAASEALKTYFSYRDAANLGALTTAVQGHTAATGEPADLPGWQKQIEADYAALNEKGDFKDHKPPEEGFLDLDESVVLALTGAGPHVGRHVRRRQGHHALRPAAGRGREDSDRPDGACGESLTFLV